MHIARIAEMRNIKAFSFKCMKKMLRRPGSRTEDTIKMGNKIMRKNGTDSYCP